MFENEKRSVDKEPHYNEAPEFEVIKVLKAWLTKEEFIGFCKGNVFKYNARAKHKGKESEDYMKAEYYQRQINEYDD